MGCGLFEIVSRHSRDEMYRKLVRIVCSLVDTGIRGLRKEVYSDLLLRQSAYLTAAEKITTAFFKMCSHGPSVAEEGIVCSSYKFSFYESPKVK
jgi:hypothetical protein